jgi:hypothetical protein
MKEDWLRKGNTALEQALAARTLEYQTRHICDARAYFDLARLALQELATRARSIKSEHARLIATQAAIYRAGELSAFEKRLEGVEELVAEALRNPPAADQHKRLVT